MNYFFILFASVLLLILGVALLFKGINLIKYLMPVVSFGGGISFPRLFVEDPNIYVLISVGIVLAILSIFFLRISVPLILGLFIGSFLYQILQLSNLPLWFMIVFPTIIGILFSILAFKEVTFKFVVTFVFSVIGSLLVMQALLILIPQSGFFLEDFFNFNIVNVAFKLGSTVYSLSMIILSVFGFFSQNVDS